MQADKLNFTKQLVESLPFAEAGNRAVYRDRKTPGLYLQVSASAKTFYWLKWVKEAGKTERIQLGRFPDLSVENARRKCDRLNGDTANGVNPAAAVRDRKAELTLAEGFDLYHRQHVAPRAKRTAADSRAMFETWLAKIPEGPRKPHGRERVKPPAAVDWSGRRLSSITSKDVAALHAKIGATGKRTTANRVVELLSATYGKLMLWGETAGPNPAAGIAPFAETKRDRFIRPDEMPRFFEALAQDKSEDFRDFVLLSLLTGARKRNVLGMTWSDINLHDREWTIPGETHKNGEPVRVQLPPEAVAILERRQADAGGDFVFPAESRTGHMESPKKRWAALLTRAEISNLTIHDVRRSLGAWQARLGASLPIIGRSLGHRTADATMIYARLTNEPVRESVEKATTAMLEAAGSEAVANVIPLRKGAR